MGDTDEDGLTYVGGSDVHDMGITGGDSALECTGDGGGVGVGLA